MFSRLDDYTLETRRHRIVEAANYEQSQRLSANQSIIAQNQNHDMNLIREVEQLLSQRYSFSEYKAPRMFIVLPMSETPCSNVVDTTTCFRLFFLCECGEYTLSEVETIMDPVHMADHGGYTIINTKLFFTVYGSHLLKMMQLIKFGKSIKGIKVPRLNEMASDEQRRILRILNFGPSVTLMKLVEYMISFLQDPTNVHDPGYFHGGGCIFKRLPQFLDHDSQDCSRGNLMIIVTPDRYAKWVCKKHWRNVTPESDVKELKKIGHSFDETTGHMSAVIKNKQGFTQLFDTLDNSHAVRDLVINLEDINNINYYRFKSGIGTVDNTGIVQLTIVGDCLKGHLFNTIHRRYRNNPILKLIGGQMIQGLHIKGIQDFFRYVTISSIVPSSQLRVLEIDSPIICRTNGNGPATLLAEIIKGCPSLARMDLSTETPSALAEHLIASTKDFLTFHTMIIEASVYLQSSNDLGRLELVLEFPRTGTNDEWLKIHIHSELKFDVAGSQMCQILVKRNENVKELSIRDSRFLSRGSLISSFRSCAKTCGRLTKLKLDIGTESKEAMKEINIAISQLNKLESLGITITFSNCQYRQGYFNDLLQDYGNKLTGLTMYINNNTRWLDDISTAFSDENLRFPELRKFRIYCSRALNSKLLPTYSKWIISLLSHIQDTYHAKFPLSDSVHRSVVRSTSANPAMDDSLRMILPRSLTISTGLKRECWRRLIQAIDFSCVEYLDFSYSNFKLKDFDYLTKTIPNEKSKLLRIKKINIRDTR
ncbi:hypothetical protein BGZ76_002038, partial [Entomortierella beljakovae]